MGSNTEKDARNGNRGTVYSTLAMLDELADQLERMPQDRIDAAFDYLEQQDSPTDRLTD